MLCLEVFGDLKEAPESIFFASSGSGMPKNSPQHVGSNTRWTDALEALCFCHFVLGQLGDGNVFLLGILLFAPVVNVYNLRTGLNHHPFDGKIN